eukprot:IDg7449t1
MRDVLRKAGRGGAGSAGTGGAARWRVGQSVNSHHGVCGLKRALPFLTFPPCPLWARCQPMACHVAAHRCCTCDTAHFQFSKIAVNTAYTSYSRFSRRQSTAPRGYTDMIHYMYGKRVN